MSRLATDPRAGFVTRFGPILGQIALIVVGVLLALWVDELREDTQERAVEREYLDRLLDEVGRNRRIAESTGAFHQNVLAHAREVYPIVANRRAPIRDTTQFLISAYQASRALLPRFVDDVYRELTTTGNLRLIESAAVRDALFAYQRVLGGQIPFDFASLDYRDVIRRLYEPDLQLAIRTHCSIAARPCDFRDPWPNAAVMVSRLHGNDEVRGGLSLVIEQWARGPAQVFEPVLERGDTLEQRIRMVLDSRARTPASPGAR